MVFVEGGSFMMGDMKVTIEDPRTGQMVETYLLGDSDAMPAHKVTLDSYSISKYETTWEEYDLFAERTNKEKYRADAPIRTRHPKQPAGVRSWYEAREYCQWAGKIAGISMDLSTEAQWEYAARSRGQRVAYATDTGWIAPGKNHRDDEYRDPKAKYPVQVGTYPPNPLGLHEMSGNVSEWVLDWYDPNYYEKSPELNPTGPEDGKRKVTRGGEVGESLDRGTSVYARGDYPPTSGGGFSLGMRCVANVAKPIKN
jgi:formylglycine-generating enzyme required for sulfatase activity